MDTVYCCWNGEMAKYFDPHLVNGPFGDPALYVDLVFEHRSLLFDLGNVSALVPRKLLRIAQVFVSHRHMDHFIGFDPLLRCLLGREKELGVWGPEGTIEGVESKLGAYTWNLITRYESNLTLRASELGRDGRIKSADFSSANGFRRKDLRDSECENRILVADPSYKVRAAILEHGIPVLAFAVEERTRINIWRSRVEEMGLAVGPWLSTFKDAILNGEDDQLPIAITWADERADRPAHLPLGQLRSEIMKETKGRKIGYIVDTAFTLGNARAIVALVDHADILFIEAPFLHEDIAHATARNHLTAKQAGTLARWANVKQLRTFHYSPRYRGCACNLADEAQAAFLGR